MRKLSSKEQVHISLVRTVERMGFPIEFGEVISTELGTEKQMSRMISWLIQYRPKDINDIADEVLAIKADFKKYRDRKIAEYYNIKYNEMLNSGSLDREDEEIPFGCYMLGEIVNLEINRPIGSYDSEKQIYYTVNYGIVEGCFGKNGEPQEAYFVGTDKPLERITGKVKAVIETDNGERWVIVPEGYIITKDEISNAIKFSETNNAIVIIM